MTRTTIIASTIQPSEAKAEQLLTQAIEGEVAVHIFYRKAAGEPVELRAVSPYELFTSQKGHRLVKGWDHDREQVRQFRLGRVRGVIRAEGVSYVEPV